MNSQAISHIMVIAGTRPEAIKMAPIVAELRRRPERFRCTVVSSGQHREMLYDAMRSFGLTVDVDLAIMRHNQTLPDLTAAAIQATSSIMIEHRPDFVLLQGDTTTVLSAALAAHYNKIDVGHVEAGLRTHDRYNPFPEEMNRTLLGPLASYHFAPTSRAADNLKKEGIEEKKIFITGNTVVDALETLRVGINERSITHHVRDAVIASKGRFVIVTLHRRESLGHDIEVIVASIYTLAARHPDRTFFFPVHLNPNVRKQIIPKLGQVKNIVLSDPINYIDMLYCLSCAELVLTDSGGLQEEAPSFCVPTLVLRRTTERQEGIEAGFCKLVPLEHNSITSIASLWLETDRRSQLIGRPNPYGDGQAAIRIVDILAEELR
jgi:UDP-N-acetylglucosamine 2-epimerase (non-hydrolysing)